MARWCLTERTAIKRHCGKARSREGACALLAALALSVSVQLAYAQMPIPDGARVAKASNRALAEAEYAEAVAARGKLTRRDLLEAVRLYGASSVQFLKAGMREQAASAEIQAGNTRSMMSGFAQAISAYRYALILGGDATPVRCAALTKLAWTEANIGFAADSLRDAADAVQECVQLKDNDAPAYARAMEAKGEAEFFSAQVSNATASLARARELAASAGDIETEALSGMMLAYNVHSHDPVAARRLLASSMELWSRSGNRYGTARAQLVAAYFAGREGDYAAAECAARNALTLFEKIADSDNAAIAYNNLGMVARNFGDEDAAVAAYTRARRLFAAAGDELGEGDAISGLMELSVASNYLRSSGPELYARGRYREGHPRQGIAGNSTRGYG